MRVKSVKLRLMEGRSCSCCLETFVEAPVFSPVNFDEAAVTTTSFSVKSSRSTASSVAISPNWSVTLRYSTDFSPTYDMVILYGPPGRIPSIE